MSIGLNVIDSNAVRLARKRARLTQRGAAQLIGASVRTWQQWEGGQRNMPAAKFAYFLIITDGGLK
jgi:DNA-binding transcriptional regulator YiaG